MCVRREARTLLRVLTIASCFEFCACGENFNKAYYPQLFMDALQNYDSGSSSDADEALLPPAITSSGPRVVTVPASASSAPPPPPVVPVVRAAAATGVRFAPAPVAAPVEPSPLEAVARDVELLLGGGAAPDVAAAAVVLPPSAADLYAIRRGAVWCQVCSAAANGAAADAVAADAVRAKYTCPGCMCRYCSLACCAEHKEETGCSGRRDPGAYVPLGAFSDATLAQGVCGKGGRREGVGEALSDLVPCEGRARTATPRHPFHPHRLPLS